MSGEGEATRELALVRERVREAVRLNRQAAQVARHEERGAHEERGTQTEPLPRERHLHYLIEQCEDWRARTSKRR